MSSKKKKKFKKILPLNLIIIGIVGVFIPILPAVLLIVVGILLMFPNFYFLLKDNVFKESKKS